MNTLMEEESSNCVFSTLEDEQLGHGQSQLGLHIEFKASLG